jgi:hypothetical protein
VNPSAQTRLADGLCDAVDDRLWKVLGAVTRTVSAIRFFGVD